MKNIKILLLSLSLIAGLFSCENKSDELTGNANEGGLLDVKSELVAYVIGNGNTFQYEANLGVFQGAETTTSIDVFKKFTNKAGVTSNEIFYKNIIVPSGSQNANITISSTYPELINGLSIGGAPLPTSDIGLKIGEFWSFRYVAKTASGKSQASAKSTKIAIGTRFAGKYKVLPSSAYWRIGVPTTVAGWIGGTRIIESVDATTYKFIDFAGGFGPANTGNNNTHYFTIDGSDVVRTPVIYNGTAQILGTFPTINCQETPSSMTNACSFAGLQNTVVRKLDGKDLIYRSYGYLNPTGPREIYEVLEKIVE
jgi:hypothetical protein